MIRLHSHTSVFFVLTALAFGLSGCVSYQSENRVAEFSAATTDLADQVIQSCELVGQIMEERRILELAKASPEEVRHFDPDTFDSVVDTRSPEPELMENNELMMSGLQSLRDYSASLTALCQPYSPGSEGLYESVQSMNDFHEDLTGDRWDTDDGEIGLALKVLDGLNHLKVESERKDQLETLVSETHPMVGQTCDAIILHVRQNLSELGDYKEQIYTSYVEDYKREVAEEKITSIGDKSRRIREIVRLKRELRDIESLLRGIEGALERLKEAHDSLQASILHPEYSDEEIRNHIIGLVSYTADLRQTYEGYGWYGGYDGEEWEDEEFEIIWQE